jgi:hypothetical protein
MAIATVAFAVGAPAPAGAAATPPPVQFGVGGFGAIRDHPDPLVRQQAFRSLEVLGVKWIRTDISWDKVETEPGVFDWTRLDQLVTEAHAFGFKILAVLNRTADFARPEGTPEWYPPMGKGPLTAYSAFVRQVALRYTEPGHVRIHAVEIWNEQNNPYAWAGSMKIDVYKAILRRAWIEMKAVNKATQVITGGLAPGRLYLWSVAPRTFVKRLYAVGGKPWFDAIGMHPYTFPALASDRLFTGWAAMTRSADGEPSIRATMKANGDGAKKIWSTEFGSPVSLVGEARQAEIATDAVQLWRRYAWAGPFMYMAYSDQPGRGGWHESMGLLHADFTPRPSYAAYRSAIRAP